MLQFLLKGESEGPDHIRREAVTFHFSFTLSLRSHTTSVTVCVQRKGKKRKELCVSVQTHKDWSHTITELKRKRNLCVGPSHEFVYAHTSRLWTQSPLFSLTFPSSGHRLRDKRNSGWREKRENEIELVQMSGFLCEQSLTGHKFLSFTIYFWLASQWPLRGCSHRTACTHLHSLTRPIIQRHKEIEAWSWEWKALARRMRLIYEPSSLTNKYKKERNL